MMAKPIQQQPRTDHVVPTEQKILAVLLAQGRNIYWGCLGPRDQFRASDVCTIEWHPLGVKVRMQGLVRIVPLANILAIEVGE